jgi:hypothetical protein
MSSRKATAGYIEEGGVITETPKRTRRIPENTVRVTLDADVYKHFDAKAKDDDRELGKFLARLLKQHHRESKSQVQAETE